MRNKLLLTLLFPGALCGGQTTPTAPGAQTIVCPTGSGPVSEGTAALCPPATSTVPSPETTSYPPGTTPGVGTLPPGVAPTPATNVPPPYKPIGPITTQTEFQILAEDEAGHPLKVFGREHTRCPMDLDDVGFPPAKGRRGDRPGRLHEDPPVAAPDSRRSNCCRGELGRWADDFSFAVSRATTAAHSLFREPGVGPRCCDHSRGDGASGESS
jgi:hypothetical protein